MKEATTKGESLISIPYDLCISVSGIISHPFLSPIFEDNAGLLDYPDEVLAIGLMFAMLCNENVGPVAAMDDSAGWSTYCPWALHVQTMPTTFNTPLYWSEAELEKLKGHNIFHMTNLLKRQMQHDFSTIHAPFAEHYPDILGGITFEHYVWALSIVYSRAIDVSTTEGKSERIIVPVLDMVNHHPSLGVETSTEEDVENVFQALTVAADSVRAYETFHYDAAKRVVSLLAGRAYAPKPSTDASLPALEEVFAIYGHYSNAKLLYSYGFTLGNSNNPYKGVDVYTKLTPQTRLFEIKQQLISQIPHLRNFGAVYDFSGTVQANGKVSEDLFAYVRVLQAQEAEVNELIRRLNEAATSNSTKAVREITSFLSLTNEIATVKSTKELLLARARVTVAQDEKTRLGTIQMHLCF